MQEDETHIWEKGDEELGNAQTILGHAGLITERDVPCGVTPVPVKALRKSHGIQRHLHLQVQLGLARPLVLQVYESLLKLLFNNIHTQVIMDENYYFGPCNPVIPPDLQLM